MNHGLMIERKGFMSSYYNHYLSVRVQGPGTVWIQSGAMGKTQEHQSISGVGPNAYIRDL